MADTILGSSIVKKYWMALTGLFLIVFLLGHLAGNLQLLATGPDAKDNFNLYAKFMTTNPAVKILSYLTYFSILFHAFDGIYLTIQNRKARPEKYAYNKPSANSSWGSRNMALLGSIILVFIILHMVMFWKRMHFGPIEEYTLASGEKLKDLYTITKLAFQESLPMCFVYLVAMIALYFHLDHGFQSAFQSLGFRFKEYKKGIIATGKFIAIAIPALFAFIPFYIHFVL